MAHMIQIRQRIKAIETIKKITHAMRLISMSSHTKLKSAQAPLFVYKNALSELYRLLKSSIRQQPTSEQIAQQSAKRLVILVGSQKGLCGNFNTSLFYLFDEELKTIDQSTTDFIAVGKKAFEYLQKRGIQPIDYIRMLSAKNKDEITQTLISAMHLESGIYTDVVLYSNETKTFFLQKPKKHVIVPLAPLDDLNQSAVEDYRWERDPSELLPALKQQVIGAHVHALLFDSLLSEQAARFISMDGATRNADSLLEQTKLSYNKLRQFSITKELAELMGNL